MGQSRHMHPQALLESCADVLRAVLKFDHPTDAVLARYFREHRGLGPRDRATLAQVAYTVLRKKLLFEHFAPFGSGPRERRLAILGFPDTGDFLRAALTEPEKRWLDECLPLMEGADLLERHRHNLPEWLVAELKAPLGAQFWPFVRSLEQTAALDLRVNTLQAKREQVRAALAQAGVEAVPTPFAPDGLRVTGKPSLAKVEAFVRGDVEVQDEGSQLLSVLVDAHRGELVVDFCAGAGGKTLALGAAMRNTGRLYAFDVSAHRLEALRPRLARSGLSNVHPTVIAHERDDRIKRMAGKVDRVLVDAPCSGLGTLRRSPDLKWRHNAQTVADMAQQQTRILHSAARLLKPGGRLVYATCSILAQENEGVATEFAASHPAFEALDAAEVLRGLKVPDPERLCAGGEAGARYLRMWPHMHGTDGFFAAIWQKK